MSVSSKRLSRSEARHKPSVIVPAQAQAAGYVSLIFNDDFTSAATFDASHSGAPGFNWYLDRLNGWVPASMSEFSIVNSVLTISQTDSAVNCGISTMCSVSGNGQSFDRAYFEARMRFDPAKTPYQMAGHRFGRYLPISL